MRNAISLLVISHPLWLWAIALALALLWAKGRELPSATAPDEHARTRRGEWTIPAAVVGGVVVLLAGALVAYALWRPDFAGRDSFVFTTYTLVGENFPPPVWPPDNRFWPLGLQEYNLIRHLTTSPVGYHLLPVTQLMIVLAGLWRLTSTMPAIARVTALALLLATPGVAIAFTGLVYPERSIVFCLVIMLVLVQRWDRAPSRLLLAGILAAAHFALYYKEIVFLLLAGFAGTRLLLRATNLRAVFTVKGREVEWGMLGLSALWTASFLAFQVRAADVSYAARFELPVTDVLTSYARVDPLLFVFLAVAAWRAIRIAARRIEADQFWDPLAIGGAVFAVAYFGLKLYRPYYMAPVDVIAVLYLVRLVSQRLMSAPALPRLGTAVIAVFAFAVAGRTTVASLAELRGTVTSKVALADWLRSRIEVEPARGLDLFLPFTNSFDLMELAAFLRYKGLPVELVSEPQSAAAVRLHAPLSLPGGRCSPWWQLRCYESQVAPRGTFVLVLPEDSVTPEQHAATASLDRLLVTEQPTWVAAVGGPSAQSRTVQVYRVP